MSRSIVDLIPVDDDSLDSDSNSDASSSTDDDSYDMLDRRLGTPTEYFQELDILESNISQKSLIQFYTDGTTYTPFNGHLHMRVGYGGRCSVKSLRETDTKDFLGELINAANAQVLQMDEGLLFDRYDNRSALDEAIENIYHLIECRHIMLWIMQGIEDMKNVSYCGEFISILVVDPVDDQVARLLPIQCESIRQLAIAFESSATKLIGLGISIALQDAQVSVANEVTEKCREFLSTLRLNVRLNHFTESWRCAVHILDIALMSYAGAHTKLSGTSTCKTLSLPGPFLSNQYFKFQQRPFLCLDKFLGGKAAWVLEYCHPRAPQRHLQPLYLSTDATTFADIWGPMWKTCAIQNGMADESLVLRYDVGNGVILPWIPPSKGDKQTPKCDKNEVLCHWLSDKDFEGITDLTKISSSPLNSTDILMIGARTKLEYDTRCNLSKNEVKNWLRTSKSIFELGTSKPKRVLDSEAIQLQVGPPYVKGSVMRTYKRRGKTWKEAWTEAWKNSPDGRNVRILEWKFGVEVSACTLNSRRRRLITLLGSKTILDHLRNGALTWESPECEKSFYTAIQSSDRRAFRKLYLSHQEWRSDLGKAITHCLDALIPTGTSDEGLDMHWAPDTEPGYRVTLPLRDHSWIGFLKDTETCCTMAIFEEKCLKLPDTFQGNICRSITNNQETGKEKSTGSTKGSSVLETSFFYYKMISPKICGESLFEGPTVLRHNMKMFGARQN